MNSLFYKKYKKYKNKYLLLKISLIGGRYKCNPTELLTKDICEKNEKGEYENLADCTSDCLKKRKDVDKFDLKPINLGLLTKWDSNKLEWVPYQPSAFTSPLIIESDYYTPMLKKASYYSTPMLKEESDYSTPMPYEIIQYAISLNIFADGIPSEIDSLKLKGHFFHGIKQRVITLMQILQSNGIGSQNYISDHSLIVPGIKSRYREHEKNWISFGFMHHTPNMSTYCHNSIFFINKNPNKALELKSGREIGIKSHMSDEYYFKDFISLENLILCIDFELANKKISELESPFVEHKYFTKEDKKNIIRLINNFFKVELGKLSIKQSDLNDDDLERLISNDEIFKQFYINNLLTLVKNIKVSLGSFNFEDLQSYDITIDQFIKLLGRYYKKDIEILKVIFTPLHI